MINSCLIKNLWCVHFVCFTLFRSFTRNISDFYFPSDKYGKTVNIYMLQSWADFIWIFWNCRLKCARFGTTDRLPDSSKRQVTSLARISNLPVVCRVKYSSSKTEAFPYLVFQSIDDTGRITDTRRHTYDPITFRMQITPSNHELEQRYPAISPSSILFDPVYS